MQSIIRGAPTEFFTRFLDTNGSPITPTASPTFVLFDPNGSPVTQGTGQQSLNDPTMFSTNVSVPISAPLTTLGNPYNVVWSLLDAVGTHYTNKESFYLVDAVPPIANPVVLPTEDVVVSVEVPKIPSQNPVCTVYQGDAVVVTQTTLISTGVASAGGLTYSVTFVSGTLLVSDIPYTAIWTIGGDTNRYSSAVHVTSVGHYTLMTNFRSFIDKSRIQDGLTTLDYSDYDLLLYLSNGLALINGWLPQATSWTFSTIPKGMDLPLLFSATYCGLSAQYLAEGMSAFDFSGQQVSLTVNRTDVIDSTLSRVADWLDTNLERQKRVILRSGNVGHLNIQLGKHTNAITRSVGVSPRGLPVGRYRF